MMSINELFGVNPDNIRNRIVIGVLISVIGAIFVGLAIFYSLNTFGQSLAHTQVNLSKTISASQNMTFLLSFLYIIFISSVMYYILLPWRNISRVE